jgi:pyridoxine kinase
VNILSVQSWVAYGHVGNAAAILPLQRLGHEVWGVHTVQFSNHPGHGSWRGRVTPAAEVAALLDGIAELGLLPACDAILAGYLGEAATGSALLATVKRARALSPKLIFCCDPVMGDADKGVYVRPDLPPFYAEAAVPAADIVTPNQFELGLLTGSAPQSLSEVVAAARSVIARGPAEVLISGLEAPILSPGKIGAALVTRDRSWLASTPKIALEVTPKGTGDLLTALYLGRRLQGEPPPSSLSLAVAGVYVAVHACAQTGLRELPLAAAQDQIIGPASVPAAEPI